MTIEEARRLLQTDEVAQELLRSPIVARLGYTWRDGSPRVVPMWFHWTGEELLMGAPPNSPKMKVLATRPQVAVSIDTVEWPYKWLTLRGTASVQVSAEPFAEYLAMARQYLGEVGGTIPHGATSDVSSLGAYCHSAGRGTHPGFQGSISGRMVGQDRRMSTGDHHQITIGSERSRRSNSRSRRRCWRGRTR
jgi:Pyridoxamine 5'-phosphate oxidase